MREDESMKRAYYSSQVNKDFEKTFDFSTEEDRNDYFEYCGLYSNFGKTGRNTWARKYKQNFYFLFLLAFPLRIPFTPVFFLIAALLSIFEKKTAYNGVKGGGGIITRIFTDEEPMNLALLLMLLFSTPFVRLFLYACLLLWAFLMWCEWG